MLTDIRMLLASRTLIQKIVPLQGEIALPILLAIPLRFLPLLFLLCPGRHPVVHGSELLAGHEEEASGPACVAPVPASVLRLLLSSLGF